MNTKTLETKRIIIFLATTFLLTIGYCVGIIYPALKGGDLSDSNSSVITLLIAVVMFFPSIGVLFTRLITKEGFKNCWLNPHFKGNIKVYLLAYFAPGILTVLGALVYFLVIPGSFDKNCGYMQQAIEATGVSPDAYPVPLPALLAIQTIEGMLLGPILNFIPCFGEEWGWRGYLLPKMSEKLSPIPMLLINGIIWGLWHAPLTAIGHNYGVGYPGFPFTGILAMCCFCIVMGTFLSYVAMKSRSCIPSMLAHGAINSIAATGMYFTKDGGNPFIGPAPTGILGGIPFIITAVVIVIFYFRKASYNNSNNSTDTQ